MSVAKPSIVSEPVPRISHSEDGLPGLEFSQEIALPVEHGSAAWPGAATMVTRERPRMRAVSSPATRRSRICTESDDTESDDTERDDTHRTTATNGPQQILASLI